MLALAVLVLTIPAVKLDALVLDEFIFAIVLFDITGGTSVPLVIEHAIPYTEAIPVDTVTAFMLLGVAMLPITLPVITTLAVLLAVIPVIPAPVVPVEPLPVIEPIMLLVTFTTLGVAADVLMPVKTAAVVLDELVLTIEPVPVVAPMVFPVIFTLPPVTDIPVTSPVVPV